MIPQITQTISQCLRDEVLYNKVLYKSTLFYFAFTFDSMQSSLVD